MAAKEQVKENDALQDRVIHIARVAKVVKGGRRFSFSALVVVGDGIGSIGFGVGKANEVPDAIRKASEQAKKNMMNVPIVNGTIPYEVVGQFGASSILMKPAPEGKGLIAGGAARVVMEFAGYTNIISKIHGSKNHHNVVRATVQGLKQLMKAEVYAANRGKSPEEVIQFRHPVAK